MQLKSIYSGQSSLTIWKDGTGRLNTTTIGLSSTDKIEWRINKNDGDVISISPSSDGLSCDVAGINAGTAEVTATLKENGTTLRSNFLQR